MCGAPSRARARAHTTHCRHGRPHPPTLAHLPLPPRARAALARAIGFMPLWIHDGSYLPFPVRAARVTVVVGKPVPVPLVPDADDATVRLHLNRFVDAMRDLYDRHAAAAGCAGVPLEIL